ncbi:hypothetical protein ACFQNE_02640 [Gordonia phosphorivorans]|uniref:Uncharacterized protein n=1 Tax=Gordonia phosphorivorans TaxID=1056982 RepID=A0ABV6H4J1_9ACTN
MASATACTESTSDSATATPTASASAASSSTADRPTPASSTAERAGRVQVVRGDDYDATVQVGDPYRTRSSANTPLLVFPVSIRVSSGTLPAASPHWHLAGGAGQNVEATALSGLPGSFGLLTDPATSGGDVDGLVVFMVDEGRFQADTVISGLEFNPDVFLAPDQTVTWPMSVRLDQVPVDPAG